MVTDPRMRGAAEACGFCGHTTGMCTTSIVRKKINSTGPCLVPLKLAVAMHKPDNMPRECLIPRCSATLWVLDHQNSLGRLPSNRGTKHR